LLDDSLRLEDLGVSAFRSKNARVGALAEFLEAVKSGRVAAGSVLILENIDRLSRNKVGIALQLFIGILNAGITIVTATPEREYTQESINDVAALLEPIIYMSRAYDESRVKSSRLCAVWSQRTTLAAVERKPHSAMGPSWIKLTPDGYRLIPERAATIRAIFKMAVEGLGAQRIVQRLVADPKRYPPFGMSQQWNRSYVHQILKNRAVIGEYQPRAVDPETGKRILRGEPIPAYYPAVISEKEFDLARAAIQHPHRKPGRPSSGEKNVFTGLVKLAGSGYPMHSWTNIYTNKHYLKSDGVNKGDKGDRRGRIGRAFEYGAFERAVLSAVSELKPADLEDRDGGSDAREEAIRSETESLIALDHKLSTLKAKAADPKTKVAALPAILEMVEATAQAKQDTAKRLEKLKADAMSGRPETLGEAQSLVKLLANAKGKEAETLRRRLKSRLRLIIDEIWVVVERLDHKHRAAHIQLCYRGGATKYTVAFSPKPPVPSVADALSGKYTLLPLWNVDFRTLDPNSPRGPLAGYVKIDDDVIKALERLTWKPGSR
jgi:DNA invertase Pin-like site-specific DNA recombinase